jgi:carboxyl-terminal processing protease
MYMNKAVIKKKFAFSIFLWSIIVNGLFLGCAQHGAVRATDYSSSLEPTQELSQTAQEVVKAVGQTHYVHHELDDRFSSAVFDRYLADVDPPRSSFLAKDIQGFERYRYTLDEALDSGDLKPAFIIYNRYQELFTEQLLYCIDLLENKIQSLNFDIDEKIETERKNAPWPADAAELKDLWRRRVKASLLNLKLAGKTTDQARDVLLKRYRNQLNQIKQIKPEDVVQIFMNSYARCYDPHTEYLPPRVSDNFNISMSLSLEGIGAVLQNENEYTKVVSLVKGGPADKVGQLKPADRIIGVGQGADGEIVNVVGWRIDDVVQLIRGPKQTQVRLEVIPAHAADEHQSKIISIVRDTVKLEEQAAKKKIIPIERGEKTFKIGVIDIPTFYHDFKGDQASTGALRSTAADVRRLLNELGQEKVSGIVLDLRDNGGGALNESIAVSGLFIDKGPIVQVKDSRDKVSVLNDPEPGIAYAGPLVVLVGRTSASASEILVGAMQDYHRAIIMGDQTFGKGTVQALLPLSKGQMKVTQAKFYRITGESTQHKGVSPDITCPSIYDKNKIGESALPDALAWDKIQAADYKAWPDLAKAIVQLNRSHELRAGQNPDYIYLKELADHIRTVSDKTLVSLSEDVRRKEDAQEKKWRLDHENKRREAKKLPLLDKLPDNDTDMDNATGHDNQPAEPGIDKDPVLTEAANVLVDYLPLATPVK